MRSAALLLALGLLAASDAAVAAEHDAGTFVVHYTLVPTLELTPQIAEQYGIVRRADRALLNVTVVRKQPGTVGQPIAALVLVTAVGSGGQAKPITLRRVDEPPSVYYLGELTVADRETINLDLSVLPEGVPTPVRLRLQQQFFTR